MLSCLETSSADVQFAVRAVVIVCVVHDSFTYQHVSIRTIPRHSTYHFDIDSMHLQMKQLPQFEVDHSSAPVAERLTASLTEDLWIWLNVDLAAHLTVMVL